MWWLVYLLGVVIPGILYWALQWSNRQFHESVLPITEWLELLESNPSAKTILARLHPELHKSIELPMLDALAEAVKDQLGPYTGIMNGSVKSTKGYTAKGARCENVTATIQFEKDKAECMVNVVIPPDGNGENSSKPLVTGFNIKPLNSELSLAKYVKPSAYEQRAETILQWLCERKTKDVMDVMHPALAKKFTAELLGEQVDRALAMVGGLKEKEFFDATLQENRRVEQPSGVEFVFMVPGERQKKFLLGRIRLIFDGFMTQLIAFELKIKDENEIMFVEQ